MTRLPVLLVALLSIAPAFAGEIGPEIEVTQSAAVPLPAQRNVHVDNSPTATLVAFEEMTPAGVSRIVLHQYRANLAVPLGRETFTVIGTPHVAQHDPHTVNSMLSYLEDDPAATYPWLTWEVMSTFRAGSNYAPQGRPERIAEVKPGTRFTVVPAQFYLLVWTAPNGMLRGAYRQIQTLIGYDESTFAITNEQALNPAGPERHNPVAPLIAYNRPEPSGKYSIRAVSVAGHTVQPAIDIAPEGASEPRVVSNGVEHFVFWSMEDGGAYVQRLRIGIYNVPEKVSEPVRFASGELHDVTQAPNNEYYAVVDEGWRHVVLRLDSSFKVLEVIPFRASVAAGEKVRISGDRWETPVLAYTTDTPMGPRAVLRLIETRTAPTKRRSTR